MDDAQAPQGQSWDPKSQRSPETILSAGRSNREAAEADMTATKWESGNQVMLAGGGKPMTVVGIDSVGSVILQHLDDERLRICVTPSLLAAAEPDSLM
jgi:hypothetical protein